jgi:STE24 endopeptidase
MGPEATARSNSYFEGNYWILLLNTAVAVLIAAALLYLGWIRAVRSFFERSVKIYPLVVLLTALIYVLITSIVTLPLDFYVGFVREHQYNLSNETIAGWAGEAATGLVIGLITNGIGLTILYLVVRATGKAWWIWGTGVAVLLAAFYIFASPILIEPRFNTYTPMAEGPLKTDILAMARANGVPADNVYVYDRSRQTRSISANVSGLFGTTHVNIADTLLQRCDPACVRAVLGHELGHYVLGHGYSLLVMNALLFLAVFALLNASFLALTKNERWGIKGISDPAGLPLAFGLVAVILLVFTPVTNTITRFHELQADMFGYNTAREPDGFAEASILLSEYRKMHPAPWEEFVFYDHPSGWTRVHNAMVWKANEIAAGRLPNTPGGPPPGWRPDFVVMGPVAANAPPALKPAPSPGARSNSPARP